MSRTELTTNIFPISNLDQLATSFTLFRVRGLNSKQPEYHTNRSHIELALKRVTHSSVVLYEDHGEVIAAIHGDTKDVPKSMALVRCQVQIEPLNTEREIRFDSNDLADQPFCLSVLHFLVQGYLGRNRTLWQLGSARPFLPKQPTKSSGAISLYRGFSVRPCALPDGGFGLVVDAKSHLQYREPLPLYIDRNHYRRFDGCHVVYHYSEHSWYEVRLSNFSDLTISQVQISIPGAASESLLDHLRRIGGRPLPREVAELPEDASVVGYYNNASQLRHMPAALCYQVASMAHPDARRLEKTFKPSPSDRLQLSEQFRDDYLSSIDHDGFKVETYRDSLVANRATFRVPDLRFGNDTVLTVDPTREDAVRVSVNDWGPTRLDLLRDPSAGFLDRQPLGCQFVIVPESMMDSYGSEFLRTVERTTQSMFPQDRPFKPKIISYNDRGKKTPIDQGIRIVEAAKAHCGDFGHALVIVHSVDGPFNGGEDQLAALVIRELQKIGIVAAVSHTDVPSRCYQQSRSKDGNVSYIVPTQKRGLLQGYVRGLVLNKILLNNERWPFALDRRLHADITIGVDVKHNTAGLLLVGPTAEFIRPVCSTSRRREKLSRDQLAAEVYDLVSAEASHIESPIQNIMIHRDGRLFADEQSGIHDAIEKLRNDRVLDHSAELTIIEIHKTSSLPFRLFDIVSDGNTVNVLNPKHGDYAIFGDTGFVCTTGQPFRQSGSVRPLQIVKLEGPMSVQCCLEDLFRLSCLAFTKPDDCSRVPVTLRLLDRRLGDEATEYDEDSFRFQRRKEGRVTA